MKYRFKRLRKTLHLTQQQFADALEIPRSTIAGYETGKEPADAVITLICKQWNVNREWLMNGPNDADEESMFVSIDAHKDARRKFDELMKNAPQIKKTTLGIFLDLLYTVPDDVWEDIVKKIDDSIKEAGGIVFNESPPEEPTIDEMVAAYRRELEIEKEAREKSGA